MNVLVGCECSGIVRDEFIKRGHRAVSCDFRKCERGGPHIQGDVLDAVNSKRWDLLVVHPDCTYLCSSGLHWTYDRKDTGRTVEFGFAVREQRKVGPRKRVQERLNEMDEAIEFVKKLLACRVPRIGLENPVGAIGTHIRPADQYIQPYEFGENASKRTGLWLKNLPPLRPTQRIPGRIIRWRGKLVERWDNQTDSGQNKLSPDEDRWLDRARTYVGIAAAMADQWGSLAADGFCKQG